MLNDTDALRLKLRWAIDSGVSRDALQAATGIRSKSGVSEWLRTGRIAKQHLPVLAALTGTTERWWLTSDAPVPPTGSWLDSATPTASALQATPPTLEQALPVVLSALRALPEAQRTAMTAKWAALLLAPDSAELARWLGQELGEQPWNGVNRRHGAERRQDDAPLPAQQTAGPFAA